MVKGLCSERHKSVNPDLVQAESPCCMQPPSKDGCGEARLTSRLEFGVS